MISQFATTFALAIAFVLSAFGWGAAFSRRRLDSDLLEYVALRIVVGAAAIYVLCIGLSLAHRMTRLPVAIVLIIGMAFGALDGERVFAKLQDARRTVRRWSRSDRLLLYGVLFAGFVQLICGLTPLIFYDSLVYHIAAPAEFLRQGSLVHIPWNVSSDTPMALQLTLGSTLALDPTGATLKLIMAVMGCLMPIGAALLAREGGPRASLWAAMFVLAYPEFWVQQTLGVVDLGAAALVVLGTAWLSRGLMIPAGIGLGFALASRYQNAPLVGLAIIFVVIHNGFTPKMLRSVVIVGVICAAMLTPWLIRNAVNTGNPIFPLLYGTLGGSDWSAEQVEVARMDALGPGFSEVPLSRKLMAPIGTFLLTPSNGLFAVVLLIGGLGMLWSGGMGSMRAYATTGLIGVVMWGFVKPALGASIIRYNAGSIVFLLAVTAVFLAGRPWICTILSSGSVIIAVVHMNTIVPVFRTLTNESFRTEYWRNQTPSWTAFDFMNRELDSERNKVLFIGETRSFWSDVPVVAAGPFNGPELKRFLMEPTGEPGLTHVFVSQSEWQRLNQNYGYVRLTEEESKKLASWLGRMRPVFDDGHGNSIFALQNR